MRQAAALAFLLLASLGTLRAQNSLIGIQYEPWFYGPPSWTTTEAVPLLGKYVTDPTTIAKHFDEFQQIGFDWLLIDWSNMLGMQPAWEQHTAGTRRIEDRTAVLFETARRLREQGKYAPKLVFMVGLQNGRALPNAVDRLNGLLAWLKTNYLDKPEYKDLWLMEAGKPLLTILYVVNDPCTQLNATLGAGKLQTSDWSVRWMGAELQNSHAEQCGMWSWLDGTIPQVLTRREGVAEEMVVTPATFRLPGEGWLAQSAIGRDHGVPYIESWKAAFAARPRYIQVHQWNEFAGHSEGFAPPQRGGPRLEVFGDQYSAQLSDDIEPTDPNGCGAHGCGGWGYYYYNLTRAIISLYRGKTPGITVLALSGPSVPVEKTTRTLDLHWSFLGKPPASYSLLLDGRQVASGLHGTAYTLDLTHVSPGPHKMQLNAAGVTTRFDLDPAQPTTPSPKPLPVTSSIDFLYGP